MITAIKKNEYLEKLGAHLPRQASLPVVHAIVNYVDPILGVASEGYKKYAEVSATGRRTVERTIPALHRHGLLRKQSRRDGPPVLWLPELMDMRVEEAVRRAGWLAHHKDENPQNYFRAGNGKKADCAESKPKTTYTFVPSREAGTQLELREQRRTKRKSSAHANDWDILDLIHTEWDAQGLTPEDPQALTKAIHATGNSRPERFKNMDGRALRKAYQRARGRLPAEYDRWIGLVEKWDKSYTRQKARNLVDRLLTAVGDRPRGILDRMFDHLERQICDHLPKKVRRLEHECERLKKMSTTYHMRRPSRRMTLKSKCMPRWRMGQKQKKTRPDVWEAVWRDFVCWSAAKKRRPNHEHLSRGSVYVGARLHGAAALFLRATRSSRR